MSLPPPNRAPTKQERLLLVLLILCETTYNWVGDIFSVIIKLLYRRDAKLEAKHVKILITFSSEI